MAPWWAICFHHWFTVTCGIRMNSSDCHFPVLFPASPINSPTLRLKILNLQRGSNDWSPYKPINQCTTLGLRDKTAVTYTYCFYRVSWEMVSAPSPAEDLGQVTSWDFCVPGHPHASPLLSRWCPRCLLCCGRASHSTTHPEPGHQVLLSYKQLITIHTNIWYYSPPFQAMCQHKVHCFGCKNKCNFLKSS